MKKQKGEEGGGEEAEEPDGDDGQVELDAGGDEGRGAGVGMAGMSGAQNGGSYACAAPAGRRHSRRAAANTGGSANNGAGFMAEGYPGSGP